MKLTDLQALTFASVKNYRETHGVGKNHGIFYRTAKYTAADEAGEERTYKVQVSSAGGVKVQDLGLTPEQCQRNVQAQYDALRPGTKAAIEALQMPFSNLLQKVIVGDAMEGRAHYPNLRAVLGSGARLERLRELFPHIKTFDAAAKALRDFAAKAAAPTA